MRQYRAVNQQGAASCSHREAESNVAPLGNEHLLYHARETEHTNNALAADRVRPRPSRSARSTQAIRERERGAAHERAGQQRGNVVWHAIWAPQCRR